MTLCHVSIGSNIERETYVKLGLSALEHCFGTLQASSIYEAEPVGFAGDAFYNLVVGFNTVLTVETVAKTLRDIEIAHGRAADSVKFSARKLDLDLLLYGDLVLDEGAFQLPRSDIERYAFVLEPLAEIAPTLEHPVLHTSYSELWRRMSKGNLKQRRID